MNDEIEKYLKQRIEEVANCRFKKEKTFDDLSVIEQILVILIGIPLRMACFVAKGFFVGIGLILAYQYFLFFIKG